MNGDPDECEVLPPGDILLHFDGNLQGADGESPTQASGVSFDTGVLGQGAAFPASNKLFYQTAGNVNDQEGTLEFWINPDWNGNEGRNHTILISGGWGGMAFQKDGAANLKSIFNLWGAGGPPGAGVYTSVAEWQAGTWHHVAFTWGDTAKSLKAYVDGLLRASTTITIDLPPVSNATFQVGADAGVHSVNAVLDELHISDIERTASEIQDSYRAGLTSPGDIVWNSDPVSPDRTTRSLRLKVTSAATGTPPQDAIRVTMVELQHPNPRNATQFPPPNASSSSTFDTNSNGVCSGATATPNYNGHPCNTDVDCVSAGGTTNGVCIGNPAAPLVACTATNESVPPNASAGKAAAPAGWASRERSLNPRTTRPSATTERHDCSAPRSTTTG